MSAWLDIVEKGVILSASILMWLTYRGFQLGKWYGSDSKRVKDLETRMDKAGLEYSNLATKVQGLPEHLRSEFITRREADVQYNESSRERQRLWEEIGRIWRVIDQRKLQR